MKNYKAFRVGALPVQLINKVLNTHLEPGELWVSKAAHSHIATKHSDDYQYIIGSLHNHISNPQYIGIDTRHPNNFHLIRRFAPHEPVAVLIAIGFEMTNHGTYNLRSAYRIKQSDIDRRREKGLLHIAPFRT